jgi:hypothetical protein
MDQIHLSPLVDQIQLTLGHISNTTLTRLPGGAELEAQRARARGWRARGGATLPTAGEVGAAQGAATRGHLGAAREAKGAREKWWGLGLECGNGSDWLHKS